MSIRNGIALVLILISLGCLYPGLTKAILSIKVGMDVPLLGEISLHDTKQSILSTIKTLHQNSNTLVAFLILFFSVVVPVIKAVLLLSTFIFKRYAVAVHKFVSIIGKWSMADVFVVGVLLAYLATKSDDGIHAELHEGFYYFLAYCIISILASQLLKVEEPSDLL